jgi:(1->4)-alpha-D-glucan 1-alpha-D-glucosylmutase
VNAGLRIPRATYRVQLHRGFTFRDATALVPYLAALGVSHLYCSPYLRARSGSSHGYDIVDHGALNPEIGSREDFDALAAALSAHGMGQIMDVVPNHMGVLGADNAWWLDVLENGRASAYAGYFDIDWQSPNAHLVNRVLVPVLGDHYGAVLRRGELVLDFDAGAGTFCIRYHEHLFPLGPRSYAPILERAAAGTPDKVLGVRLQALAGAFEALPRRDDVSDENTVRRRIGQDLCKRQLADLCAEMPQARTCISDTVASCNGGTDRDDSLLHDLLERQAYRLAYWRVASDEINYRRFFDINDLAALRMEQEAVFDATHALVFDLVAAGQVHGLRIDHPDGLFDPAAYFGRLQERYRKAGDSGESLYVVAEKIVAPFENLPETWAVAGTTGYRFANVVNGLFVDGSAEKRLTRVYESFVGDDTSFGQVAHRCRHLVLRTALASELTVLAGQLHRIAQADRMTRDYTLNTLRRALAEVIATFPVYRSYVADGASSEDRRYIEWAIAQAARRAREADPDIFGFVRRVLLREAPAAQGIAPESARFVRQFQQLTAPVAAKGVEDTAFYIYNRLVSLNDVGSDPSEFGYGVSAFHGASADRAARWPHTLLATSTHDNKRSEDVRTRIDVLSESPAAWRILLRKWSRMNRGRKRRLDGTPAPGRNDEYLLYQTLLGSFPLGATGSELDDYRGRIGTYMRKAVREAKVESSWVNPNAEYEAALLAFVDALLAESPHNLFLADLRTTAEAIAWPGMLNSLSMVLVKFTSPGVPDLYQGNETWDHSLVDPDNRRPVDYERRRRLLAEVEAAAHEGTEAVRALFVDLDDGRAKLYLTWRLLQHRRADPQLFRDGSYVPLQAEGARAAHVVAYARRNGDRALVTIAGRLFATLGVRRPDLPCGAVWEDTRIAVPFLEEGETLTNLLGGERCTVRGGVLQLSEALAHLPGAVLVRDRAADAT